MTMLKDSALSFNHAVWTANTELTMFNVPWNNDYRDVVKFDTRAALDAYLNAIPDKDIITTAATYAKVSEPIKINQPLEVVQNFNYIRAKNGAKPVPGAGQERTFYYFILDVRYVTPSTTEIVVQLDVFQSFIYDMEFGNSYVDRGHIGIANSKAFDNAGRDYLTIPEGLDIGSEYVNVAYKNNPIMRTAQSTSQSDDYRILIVTTIDLFSDYGDINTPRLSSATGQMIQGLPSGANVYTMLPGAFPLLMTFLKDRPWIAQGIQSITAIPQSILNFGYNQTLSFIPGSVIQVGKITGSGAGGNLVTGITAWRESAGIQNYIPDRYKGLKKLLTSPYCMIEVTAFNGKALFLKPESWSKPNSDVYVRPVLLPPQLKLVFTPVGYNNHADSVVSTGTNNTDGMVTPWSVTYDDGGDFLDVSTMIDNFPQFSIVNDNGIMYMVNNASSIAFQYHAADWAQSRALNAAQTAYDNTKTALGVANTQAGNNSIFDTAQVNQSNQTGILGALASGAGQLVGSAGGGAAVGGVPGLAAGAAVGLGTAAMGGLNTLIGVGQSQAALTLRNQQRSIDNDWAQWGGGKINDSNKAYADFAAKGDYEASIGAMNAKIQDARMTPPSMLGQVGGEAFNMIHNTMNLSVRYKMIDHASMAIVGEYFLRYGYAVRRFLKIPTTLHVMSKFTYWKLAETYIKTAPMPEAMKQIIRGIFEKGVTVWKNPADIGNIDIADNTPIGGISY